MKKFVFVSLAIATLASGGLPAIAQPNPPAPQRLSQRDMPTYQHSTADLVKARNLARQAIETRNGGLSRYRAEMSMHGPIHKAPFVENDDGTITFTFLGGPPAYKTPTTKSIVTVNPNGWTVDVSYNGAVHSR